MSDVSFEIVYLGEGGLVRRLLRVARGTSVADALQNARAECAEFPEEAWSEAAVGIYGKLVDPKSRLIDEGDRIELLRPLKVAPVEARRSRALGEKM